MMEHMFYFIAAPTEKKPPPTAEEVEANKRKWGLGA